MAALPHLSPKPPTPDSLQATPVCITFPLQEPRVSGCEKLCIGPLKGWLCLQQALPPLGGGKPCGLSQRDAMRVPVPGSCVPGQEPGLGFRLHAPQREPPTAEISLHKPGLPPVGAGQPLQGLCPSYQSRGGFFCQSLVKTLLFR